MTSRELSKPEKPMARGVKRAFFGPLNLTVVGAAAAGAAALGSLSLLALGGAAYLALVAWDLSSATFWRKVVNPDEAPPREALPSPRAVFDAETRAAVERLRAARATITAEAASMPAPLASSLASLQGALGELDQRTGRLVSRSDELSRYLARNDGTALRREIVDLDARARRATDAESRRHYEEARAAREEQVRTLDDIAAARERLVANLARMVATLEGVPPRLMKMRALDDQAADDVSGDVGRQLEDMNLGLQALEETLESLVVKPSS